MIGPSIWPLKIPSKVGRFFVHFSEVTLGKFWECLFDTKPTGRHKVPENGEHWLIIRDMQGLYMASSFKEVYWTTHLQNNHGRTVHGLLSYIFNNMTIAHKLTKGVPLVRWRRRCLEPHLCRCRGFALRCLGCY